MLTFGSHKEWFSCLQQLDCNSLHENTLSSLWKMMKKIMPKPLDNKLPENPMATSEAKTTKTAKYFIISVFLMLQEGKSQDKWEQFDTTYSSHISYIHFCKICLLQPSLCDCSLDWMYFKGLIVLSFLLWRCEQCYFIPWNLELNSYSTIKFGKLSKYSHEIICSISWSCSSQFAHSLRLLEVNKPIYFCISEPIFTFSVYQNWQ